MAERDPNYLRSLRDELLAEGSRDPIETLVGIQNVEWHAEQLTLAADHIEALERQVAEAEALVEKLENEKCLSHDREFMGQLVREVWEEWAREQPDPKPSWLVPWNELPEPLREVDRRIAERVARFAVSPHILELEAQLAELEALVERAGEAMRGEVRGSGGSILYNCKQQRFTAWASASEAKSYPTLRSALEALAALAGEEQDDG